ncbi:uncharacterized protein E0L32_003863 [Thyridium curvatum]|uniref:Nucleolar protein 12 n=1 Tax=Thyridium curvatum TaxID=1093900 RepID=A0A507BGW8_9PEZI|nr:uncharacterized protein E0L32_003863 [Thyridium curvatum]TPX16569.1 hypothetical protein E0L32_003863 [Thyridium curvatum]
MAKGQAVLSAASKALDPTLTALFASSAGPAKPLPKTRYADLIEPRKSASRKDQSEGSDEDVEPDAELSELDEEILDDDDEEEEEDEVEGSEEEDASDVEESVAQLSSVSTKKDRKRKRADADNEDLESRYLQKLLDDEDDSTPAGKRARPDADNAEAEESDSGENLVHESLQNGEHDADLDKASRTVFLSNVSIEAISSRKAKKTLMAHLSSIFDESNPGSVETLRFRSLPFSTASMPKRAAFITGAVMDATTKSVNAYAVYPNPAAARLAVSKLNGTVVLDRHLRADSVAHPAPTAHRRCVFVGNLGFVDDETVITTKVDEEGKEKTETRKRTKTPMDVEEGLWRTFGQHAGKVENVRVVRDQVTRVGKGIAYVQFYDANSVEAAILLNGKKFPPMLPRELRVSRCKAPHKTARAVEERARKNKAALVVGGGDTTAGGRPRSTKYAPKATAEQQTHAGRAGKLLGRSAAQKAGGGGGAGGHKAKKPRLSGGGRHGGGSGAGGRAGDGGDDKPQFKSPETVIFEGQRAKSTDGKRLGLKLGGGGGKKGKHGGVGGGGGGGKKAGDGGRAEDSNNRKRQAKRTASWREKQGS